MANLTPTTELEAVNIILRTVGQMPVNTLDDPSNFEADTARTTLHNVSREVQSQGLKCNTDKKFTLLRDGNGFVTIPPNTLKIDATDPDLDVTVRGNRLYDTENHTFVFAKDVEVDIVQFLSWDELPQIAREYIIKRASRTFQRDILGDNNLDDRLTREEALSFVAFRKAEIDVADYNLFKNPDFASFLRR